MDDADNESELEVEEIEVGEEGDSPRPTSAAGNEGSREAAPRLERKSAKLPPGWTVEVRSRGGVKAQEGETYKVYHGPHGEKAPSIKMAWRKHRVASTAVDDPTPDVLLEGAVRRSSRAPQPIDTFCAQPAGRKIDSVGHSWKPPAVDEVVMVEVEDSHTSGGPEWRLASVISHEMYDTGPWQRSLRFLVCVHKPSGEPDPDFLEWYDQMNEGTEWKRHGGAASIGSLPRLDTNEPPPGWSKEVRSYESGNRYTVYHGPKGQRAHTKLDAWRKHAARDEAVDSPTNEVDEPTNTHGKPTNAQGDSHISRNDVLLPPRWISEVRARGGKGGGTGGTYTVYHGPDGLKANSRAEAWRKHDDAATSKPAPPPSKSAPAPPKAAPAAPKPAPAPSQPTPDALASSSSKGEGKAELQQESSPSSQLPAGWILEMRPRGGERGLEGETYKVYHGPQGERAQSRKEAWRKQAVSAAANVLAADKPMPDAPASSTQAPVVSASSKATSGAQLPPGWSRQRHITAKGNQWSSYRGPNGEKAATATDAWEKHQRDGGDGAARELAANQKQLARPNPQEGGRVAKQSRTEPGTELVSAPFALTPYSKSAALGLSGNEMARVADMLERFRLAEYIEKFEEQGYDDLEWLLQMDESLVEVLVIDVQMKPGHAAKFKHYLALERQARPEV